MTSGITIRSLIDYFKIIDEKQQKQFNQQIVRVLYRGQSDADPLLPSIARVNREDTAVIEREMLEYIKRVAYMKIDSETDLELLIMAQHYGLKTRLLDWSSNPLVALYFAIEKEYQRGRDSYVYILEVPQSMIWEINEKEMEGIDPFGNDTTKVLRPTLNNERIVAQSGWFTIHKSRNRFQPLEDEQKITDNITQLKIPKEQKNLLLKQLNDYGINARTLFPDFNGSCLHANWKYYDELIKVGP